MAAQSTAYQLPVEFIRKPATHALRFKNHKKVPFHRLPFVNTIPGKIGLSFWAVPRTGGYLGGNETGHALSLIYMKYLKEHGQDAGGFLQVLVLDMFGLDRSDDPEISALRGQAVGFFAALERWLIGAARHLEGGLDEHDNRALLKAANAGLNFDSDAYTASLPDEEDE